MLTLDTEIHSPIFGMGYDTYLSRPLGEFLDMKLSTQRFRTPLGLLTEACEALRVPTTTVGVALAGLHYAGLADRGVAKVLTGTALSMAEGVGEDEVLDTATAVKAAYACAVWSGTFHHDTKLWPGGFRSCVGLGKAGVMTRDRGGLEFVWKGPEGRHGHQDIRDMSLSPEETTLLGIYRAIFRLREWITY